MKTLQETGISSSNSPYRRGAATTLSGTRCNNNVIALTHSFSLLGMRGLFKKKNLSKQSYELLAGPVP